MTHRLCFLSVCALGLLLASTSNGQDKPADVPGTEKNGNFIIGPDYKIDPDLTDKGNPKGKSFEFTMKLADSKIFPGTDKTLDAKKQVRVERKIFVYVPAAYKDGTKAPVLVTMSPCCSSSAKRGCRAWLPRSLSMP